MGLVRVDGEGLEARELSFEELAALPAQVVTFRGGETGGVRLGSLLDALGLPSTAAWVSVTATDGYVKVLPIASVDDAVLLYRCGEEPLPAERGGPVRLVVQGLDPCAGLKFVRSITLSSEAGRGLQPPCRRTRAA